MPLDGLTIGGIVRPGLLVLGLLGAIVPAMPAAAQQPTIDDLMKKIDALQKRVDELESQVKSAKSVAAQAKSEAQASTRTVRAAAQPPKPAASAQAATPGAAPSGAPPRASATAVAGGAPTAAPAAAAPAAPTEAQVAAAVKKVLDPNIPGLLPPEPMGSQFETEDALRSDLPGIAIRIPGTETQVRLYGFVKLTAYQDFNARNQTDTPPPQTIPLVNSPAWQQGGDFGMSARFSRFGIDTRTLTGLGTLETRIEGDFGGGTLTSNTAQFRLRQAWAELGDEDFRVLFGQANSLWNEGVFETIIDATNLNQSFIRQPQIRLTGRLAPGLTGQVSLESPETQYTSVAGVFTPDSSLTGAPSPAFDTMPDILGRLTWRDDGLTADMRALVRRLSIRTSGTTFAPPSVNLNATGWGLAAHVSFPMRWLADWFGPDQLIGMIYYGDGIGRYFAGNTSGQDALSNLGLPGAAGDVTIDPVPTFGVIAAYRRFWTTRFRSNFSYAYARANFPSYALEFTPGSASAVFLNREMQQIFANLIWSPFATVSDAGVFGSGWLDVGLEYLFTRRDIFGGSAATGPAGYGTGIANRVLVGAVARF